MNIVKTTLGWLIKTPIEIIQSVASDLKADSYKPSPAIADLDAIENIFQFAYSQNAVANNCVIVTAVVPVGRIWAITHMIAYNNEGTVARITLYKLIGGIVYMINQDVILAKYQTVIFQGILLVNSDAKIEAGFTGCQGATDNCRLVIHGYDIDKY